MTLPDAYVEMKEDVGLVPSMGEAVQTMGP